MGEMEQTINELLKNEFNSLNKISTYNISDCGPPWIGAMLSHIVKCISVSHYYGHRMGISINSNWILSPDKKFNSVFKNTLEEINDDNFIYNDFNENNVKINYYIDRHKLDLFCNKNIFNGKYYPSILKQIKKEDKELSDIWKSFLLKKIFILNDNYQEIVNKRIEKFNLNDNYTVIHVRRGDKVAGPIKEANFIPLEDYLKLISKEDNKIFLMTDSQEVINEIIEKYSHLNIIYDDLEKRNDGFPLKVMEKKIVDYSDFNEELINALKNLTIISKSSYLIGSPASWFFRMGQLLMDYNKIQNVRYAEDLNNIYDWPGAYEFC
jgi:hypothetical protein